MYICIYLREITPPPQHNNTMVCHVLMTGGMGPGCLGLTLSYLQQISGLRAVCRNSEIADMALRYYGITDKTEYGLLLG